MAWSEMSYNRDYSRNKEIVREKDYFDAFLFEREDEFSMVENYGLCEDFSISNCYGVEDVYNDVDNWN